VTASLASSLASLPEAQRLKILDEFTEEELAQLEYDWRFWARPEQISPKGDWSTWVIDAGRGFGKTRSGAEWVREQVDAGKQRIALIAETYKDLVEVMCFGDSGLVSVFPPHQRPKIIANPNVSVRFHTGAIGLGYNATQPGQLRGPQFDCFVAGTMVATPNGQVPIESLKVGNLVLTRKGPKRIYRLHSTHKPVGEIQFSNGAKFVATADHPVYSLGRWVAAGSLKLGDQVCAIDALNGVASAGTRTVGSITNIAGQEALAAKIGTFCTGLFTEITTALYLKVTTFITSTAIALITTCKTLRQSHVQSTCDCTGSKAPYQRHHKNHWSKLNASHAVHCSGGENLTPSAFARSAQVDGPKRLEKKPNNANTAGLSSEQGPEHYAASVASIWRPAGQQDVYCIDVEDAAEFYANGILVHNCAWADELAKWRYARDTWDMLQFGLRLGDDPRALVTTTPRPIPVLREILRESDTVVTKGSTFDNAGNLAPKFLRKIRTRYEGTRLGRQELHAEMLDDLPGALWTRENLDAFRLRAVDDKGDARPLPSMRRIVVAVDPSGTGGEGEGGDSVGIVVVGKGADGRGYVIADRTSDQGPAGWAKAAVDAYHEFKADRIVAERNFGGAMVEHTIRTADPTVSYKSVTASRGKVVRAEPIAALYEQGKVSHIGAFSELEDEMCDFGPDGYIGDGSPDRVDALVWALTELSFGGETIFDVPFDRIAVAPFAIPSHWKRAYAVDRRDGSIAVLWGAIDPTDGVMHFYAEHVMPTSTMTLQAAGINARGDWIPGMFAAEAPGRSKRDGKALMKEMNDGKMRVRNVPFAEEVSETVDQVNLGRVRVFSNLTNFEREYRGYQRDEAGNLSETGMLMNCFRVWIKSGRTVASIKEGNENTSVKTTAAPAGIY